MSRLTWPIWSLPPWLAGTIAGTSAEGDIVLHVALAGAPFLAMVLTVDDALSLNLLIGARVDIRRQRSP